ncbi:hypothetical protein HMPREF0322_01901 [Desulfitobacterium hafniense DP7]|uniref:Uncharacterized protein n=1 Tax=Desulfitobacterium hafniense DP7 TaxID=537010 RepID=G9XLR6_DESHA|nr:hypothetical protein HMPREF0322_01901 [Desulfitobacterium hafniense DP7]
MIPSKGLHSFRHIPKKLSATADSLPYFLLPSVSHGTFLKASLNLV